MSDLTADNPPAPESSAPDDTAAFKRFYLNPGVAEPPRRGLLYRVLVGWWRDQNR